MRRGGGGQDAASPVSSVESVIHHRAADPDPRRRSQSRFGASAGSPEVEPVLRRRSQSQCTADTRTMLNTMWPGEGVVKVECPGSPVHLVNTDEFHRLTPPDSRAYFYPDTEEDCSNGTLVTLATLPPFQSLPPSSSPRPYFASPSETSLVNTASPDSSARTSSLASPSPPRMGRKRSNSEDSCSSATSTHRPRWANSRLI